MPQLRYEPSGPRHACSCPEDRYGDSREQDDADRPVSAWCISLGGIGYEVATKAVAIGATEIGASDRVRNASSARSFPKSRFTGRKPPGSRWEESTLAPRPVNGPTGSVCSSVL